MKLKTKIVAGLIAGSVLATSAFAYGNGHGQKGSCGMNKGHHGSKMMKSHHKGGHFFSMFKKLNLTDKQKKEMFEIRKEMMQEKQTVDMAFTKTSFDKEKFISIMKQKRENMLESKAEMMDKMYKVLTSKQKEQLKVLMDLKKEKMKTYMEKRMNFDKNCNGRG